MIQWTLVGADDTTPKTFELPDGYKNNKSQDAPPSQVHQRGKGYSRKQLAAMGGLVEDNGFMADSWDPRAKTLSLDPLDEFLLSSPEFLLHGTPSDWDSLYSSGGLYPTGTNSSLDDHVFSSSAKKTAYISGTRELSVAKQFAQSGGWIYLFHVFEGVINYNNVRHRQAEVMAVGDVPVHDILLIRSQSDKSVVYQNLGYKATVVDQSILAQAFRFIGGGVYPKDGIFWTKV